MILIHILSKQNFNKDGKICLCVKVGYAELDRCNFLARFTDENGKSLSGVKYSKYAKSYPKGAVPSVKRTIENYAEAFFEKQMIKQNPTHLENYFLLSDCYLRNDIKPSK